MKNWRIVIYMAVAVTVVVICWWRHNSNGAAEDKQMNIDVDSLLSCYMDAPSGEEKGEFIVLDNRILPFLVDSLTGYKSDNTGVFTVKGDIPDSLAGEILPDTAGVVVCLSGIPVFREAQTVRILQIQQGPDVRLYHFHTYEMDSILEDFNLKLEKMMQEMDEAVAGQKDSLLLQVSE